MATNAAAPGGNLDFGRSFTFVTEDPDWVKKILIGGVFTLLGGLLIGLPFVAGYWARTLRNIAEGAARPLPEWDDLGGIFGDGLKVFVVGFVHYAGGLLLAAIPGCALAIPAMIAGGSGRGSDAMGALMGLGIMLFYGLFLLISLALLAYVPAALVRTALLGNVGAGLAWRENVAFIQHNLANYLLSIVIYLVAGFVAQFGFILCCVGVFPAAFWSYLVLAAGLGQTARLSPVRVA